MSYTKIKKLASESVINPKKEEIFAAETGTEEYCRLKAIELLTNPEPNYKRAITFLLLARLKHESSPLSTPCRLPRTK
jgi:hypothetical protein